MKTVLISNLLLLCSLSTFGDAKPSKQIVVTAEESAKRTGGIVKRVMKNSKKVFIVNAQTRAKTEVVNQARNALEESLNTPIDFKDGAFNFPNPHIDGELTLFVIDDANMPMSLVAPEARWAFVNVSSFVNGRGAKQAFFDARVKKEIVRISCILFGNMGSSYKNNLMSFISTAEELDERENLVLPMDCSIRCSKYLLNLGVKPYRKTTYYSACEEGWAPAPTNENQRVIWNKIHALPTEPIKIKPETKPVKE